MNKAYKLIKGKYSPEQASAILKDEHGINISHETLYRRIWKDKKEKGSLYTYLRQSSKLRRKRHRSKDSRGQLANKRMIEERPTEIDDRSEFGHWEIDLIHGRGSNQCIMTLVERQTGFLIMGKLKNKSVKELNERLLKTIRKSNYSIKTITADNGTEFHGYKEIEKKTGIKFYFCNPYHSWERGTNENTNGLIRQYHAKNESMAQVRQVDCNKTSRELNLRPRKRYGFKRPIYLCEAILKNVALQG
jgi:transposase, IS30 family